MPHPRAQTGSSARLTDPWGTSIELTEGLNAASLHFPLPNLIGVAIIGPDIFEADVSVLFGLCPAMESMRVVP